MQIRSITVNAAGLAQGREVQENMPQVQPKKNGFGPECKVTISREGKALSHKQTVQQAEKPQNVEVGKTLTSWQEEYVGLKKSFAEMLEKEGCYADEIRERTEKFYEIFCSTNPFHGEIQQIMAENPTEEEMEAMNERARQSKENFDKILKGLAPADFANATPLTFDHVATLPDMPGNESL